MPLSAVEPRRAQPRESQVRTDCARLFPETVGYLGGTLYSPVPRGYVLLFPEAFRRPQAPPWPRFVLAARKRSVISAGGGPRLSELRRRRRRRRRRRWRRPQWSHWSSSARRDGGRRGGGHNQVGPCQPAGLGVRGNAERLGRVWDLAETPQRAGGLGLSTWQPCSRPARWERNGEPPGRDKGLELLPEMERGPAGSGASS